MARRGGWRRLGRRRPFRYVDDKDRRITDAQRLERIEQLVIPPAWQDVWISPNASARLQATGVDAAGRRQYLYHPDFRAAQEQAKYDRLVRFGELLPGFRARAAEHLEVGPYEREWVCALAATLVNRGWFRVGSEQYVRTGRTYGITTLTKRHVSVRGKRISFSYRGKHRVLVRTTLVDAELAEAMRALLGRGLGGRQAMRRAAISSWKCRRRSFASGVDGDRDRLSQHGDRAADIGLGGDVADHEPVAAAGKTAIGDERDLLAQSSAHHRAGRAKHFAHAGSAPGPSWRITMTSPFLHFAGRGSPAARLLGFEDARLAGEAPFLAGIFATAPWGARLP